MVHLYDMTLQEMEDWFAQLGEPRYRALQVFQWLYVQRAETFADMTNLSKSLRQRLEEQSSMRTSQEALRQTSQDGTVKFLLEWADQVTVETVLMRHDYGNSVCVSTQVGCKMGCTWKSVV